MFPIRLNLKQSNKSKDLKATKHKTFSISQTLFLQTVFVTECHKRKKCFTSFFFDPIFHVENVRACFERLISTNMRWKSIYVYRALCLHLLFHSPMLHIGNNPFIVIVNKSLKTKFGIFQGKWRKGKITWYSLRELINIYHIWMNK